MKTPTLSPISEHWTASTRCS